MIQVKRIIRIHVLHIMILALTASLLIAPSFSPSAPFAQAAPAGSLKLGDYVQFGS